MSDTKKNNRLGHMLKKLTPYNIQKGVSISETFWTERISGSSK